MGLASESNPWRVQEGWGEGFLAFFITYLGKPAETLADLKGQNEAEEGRFIIFVPFVTSRMREGT